MSVLEFFSNLAESLGWPLAAVGIALILKKPITRLLDAIRRIRTKHIEFDFDREIEEIQDQASELDDQFEPEQDRPILSDLADYYPTGAILEAWKAVEQSIRRLAQFTEVYRDRDSSSVAHLLRALQRSEVLEPVQHSIIQSLQRLRNQVVHVPDPNISPDTAAEYVKIAERMVNSLDRLAERLSGRQF